MEVDPSLMLVADRTCELVAVLIEITIAFHRFSAQTSRCAGESSSQEWRGRYVLGGSHRDRDNTDLT